jgi:hypothetical protein
MNSEAGGAVCVKGVHYEVTETRRKTNAKARAEHTEMGETTEE